MKRASIHGVALAALVPLVACGGSAPPPKPAPPAAVPAAPPPPPPTAARQAPPPPLAAKESSFPKVARTKLPNGLELAIVEAHALPIVQLRVLVRAGMGFGAPGAAETTAELLKDGGTRTMTSAQLLRRVETLGASLGVGVDQDATMLAMHVTKPNLDEALAVLAEVVREPRFDAGELAKLKERETDEAQDNARANGRFMANRVIYRELFAATNPYATYDVVPSEVAKITGATVRDFHKRFYVPKNVTVVIAGDVDPAAAAKTVERAFGTWKGGEPPAVTFPPAIAPAARRVIVVNRPKSAQSDCFVVSLAPPRQSPDWPSLKVATQVVGGGPTGRLFMDIREQRSLAYGASASLGELAHGEEPLVAAAGTQLPKTALAVQALLENFEKAHKEPLQADETALARRFLSDIFAVRMETVGAIADLVATATKLGLPDTYWDAYRAALRKVDASEASAAAAKLFDANRALVVVVGDADAIATPLTHFGDVTIVDPEHEFQTVKTLPKNEAARLEIETPK